MADPDEILPPEPDNPPSPSSRSSDHSASHSDTSGSDASGKIRSVRREFTLSIGPLPPPEILKQYNEVFPSCGERIVAMAEKQAAHRQHLEKIAIESNCRNEQVGMRYGFILCGLALMGGLVLLAMNKSAAGFTVILGDVASFAAATIYLRYSQHQERTEKIEPFQPPSLPPNDEIVT